MAVLASAILHERPRHCRPSPFLSVIVNGFVNAVMRGTPLPPRVYENNGVAAPTAPKS